MYEIYKPLRNYLRSFDLWSALGTTYHYMLYLQFGSRLPQQLLTPKLEMGASNRAANLHGHLVELLLRELILNGALSGGKRFATAPAAFKAMNLIHKVDGRSWGTHEARSNDIMLQLSRIAFKQFPWQDPPTNGSLARYYALYGHPAVAPMVEAEFGMTTTELLQLVLLLIEELQRAPTLPLVFLGEAEDSIEEPVWALYDRISHSAPDLRQLLGDVRYWVDHQTYSPDEIAVRFHHRLVWIHPFPNGNGRFSRLAADLLAVQLGAERLTWGSGNLVAPAELRRRYIDALRAENEALRARLRETAQILIEAGGADGSMNAEDAARNAVDRMEKLQELVDRAAGEAGLYARRMGQAQESRDRVREDLVNWVRDKSYDLVSDGVLNAAEYTVWNIVADLVEKKADKDVPRPQGRPRQ